MAFSLDLGNLIVHLRLDATNFTKNMKLAEATMKSASKRMSALGSQLTLKLTAPIALMGGVAAKSFASFDDAMTKSLAIMKDVTPVIRKEMEDLAIEISVNGVTSAKDLAKSYFFLASASLDAEQSMAALAAVERFAVAGAFDMATATDLATDAQSALGLTVKDAQANLVNMTRVTDVLIGANTLANASTEQFALALTSQAGPAMKAYGISLEEGVAVLAAFADQGIKAQVAGSLFSRMLRLTTKGFLDNATAWQRFNINIFDTIGNLKPMSEIVRDLSNALGDMAPKQKIATLDLLGFKARSQQAILPLLGLGDRIEEYTRGLERMSGITKNVANKQLQSFSSQMKIVKNNVVALGIEFGRVLAPTLKSFGESVKETTGWLRALDEETKKTIVTIALLTAAIGPALLAMSAFLKLILLIKAAVVLLVAHPVILALIAAVGALTIAWRHGVKGAKEYNEVINIGKKIAEETALSWDLFAASVKGVEEAMDVSKANRFLRLREESLAKIISFTKQIEAAQNRLQKAQIAGGIAGTIRLPNVEKQIEDLKFRIKLEQDFLTKLGELKDKEIIVLQKAADEMAAVAKPALAPAPSFFGFDIERFNLRVQEWVDAAKDISTNIADAFTEGLDRLGDGINTLLHRGEADLQEIMASVFQSITGMIIKAQLAAAVQPFLEEAGGGGGETAAAATNQATAIVNETAATINQTAAITNQAAAITNELSSLTNEFAAVGMEFAAVGNEAAAGTMGGAAIAMNVASAEMMAAAIINAGSTTAGVSHRGGMIGRIGPTRKVPASTFIGAPRLHQGLADDEFATILQRGEVVLDKRNVAEMKDESKSGLAGGGDTTINNFHVSAIDQRGISQFFKQNRKTMVNAIQTTKNENNKTRRSKR